MDHLGPGEPGSKKLRAFQTVRTAVCFPRCPGDGDGRFKAGKTGCVMPPRREREPSWPISSSANRTRRDQAARARFESNGQDQEGHVQPSQPSQPRSPASPGGHPPSPEPPWPAAYFLDSECRRLRSFDFLVRDAVVGHPPACRHSPEVTRYLADPTVCSRRRHWPPPCYQLPTPTPRQPPRRR